ncbi:hypothetical protein POM88_049449 [Heracleum sosnowskyi]|uniref:Uncharacterized protein n=1 Tax=Heracleum sosnowskyi TaxID=360622 RepID=A0AAD8M1P2_9APIA|nr:hypothetical protein POM88_049449 [Heracleum sosnowskyi]
MDKLQWGSRKRLRCVKVKECSSSSSVMNGAKSEEESGGNGVIVKKKTTSRVDRRVVTTAAPTSPNHLLDHNNNDTANTSRQVQAACPCPPFQSPIRLHRDLGTNRSSASENRKMLSYTSPEKEDRYYSTRGSGIGILDDNSKMFMEAAKEKKVVVWPKLYVALSSKEKEEDFLAMKGCKPPHRPKKRAKIIQKSVLFVSPGQWLSDLCQERYEVREKKTSKKRPRGLKAMGSMETDSE